MTLREAVRTLDQQNDDAIFCVRCPWTPNADCVVPLPNEVLGVPTEIKQQGYIYFLEVSVAREVLEVLQGKGNSIEDQVSLLIYYAENDAFPDWVYG